MRRELNSVLLAICIVAAVNTVEAVEFNVAERELIAQYGPWPPVPQGDSSNRVSGNQSAVRLGEALFFDHDLGFDSNLSCASCHDPGKAFTDGRATGLGRMALARNTPSLLNLKLNRWFGWGGENDSLWAQSIRPILAVDEMAASPEQVKMVLLGKERYREFYRLAFEVDVEQHQAQQVLANVGKALAAYQEILVSPRSAFDDFRDALVAGDAARMANYPETAQRGLKIFIGEGRCNLCHLGPRFTSGEFGDVGIPYFTAQGVDAGRYRGIQQLQANPYNLLGKFNDGDPQQNAVSTSHVKLSHRNWGEFKIPGLRSVALTAPYMHNGSLQTLRDVVQHYSRLDEERLHTDGEKILRPLNLTSDEIDDLLSFLQSLGSE